MSKMADLAQFYVDQGLSASQIAERCELSNPAILRKLHAAGIRAGAGNGGRSPDNYRFAHNPPYGRRVVDGNSSQTAARWLSSASSCISVLGV